MQNRIDTALSLKCKNKSDTSHLIKSFSDIYRSTCVLPVFYSYIRSSFFTEPTPSNHPQHLNMIKCSAFDLSEHIYSFNADDVEEDVIREEVLS